MITATQAAARQRRKAFRESIALKAEELRISREPQRHVILPVALPKLADRPLLPTAKAAPIKRDWLYVASVGAIENTITVKHIQRAVSAHFKIPLREMLSPCRSPVVATPRQISVYLSRVATGKSFPNLARDHGFKNHGTALYAFRKIAPLIERDVEIKNHVSMLKNQLGVENDG